jgi:mRNA interferase MazF
LLRRGDVVALPAPRGRRGHEQKGRRYAVVLQSEEATALSTVIVAPTSTSALSSVFRPEIRIGGRSARVLADQLGAADRTRLGRVVTHLSESDVRRVEEAAKAILGLL